MDPSPGDTVPALPTLPWRDPTWWGLAVLASTGPLAFTWLHYRSSLQMYYADGNSALPFLTRWCIDVPGWLWWAAVAVGVALVVAGFADRPASRRLRSAANPVGSVVLVCLGLAAGILSVVTALQPIAHLMDMIR